MAAVDHSIFSAPVQPVVPFTSLPIAHLDIEALACVCDALMAATDALAAISNQPRCLVPAAELLEELCERNEALLVDVVDRMETLRPADAHERAIRFRSLSAWAARSCETPLAMLAYLARLDAPIEH